MEENKFLKFFEEIGVDIDSNVSVYLKERSVDLISTDWDKVKNCPVAHLSEENLDIDITKLILKRYFAGEGSLSSDQNYQEILESTGSIKVMSGKSLGAYSDVIASLAEVEGLNLNLIRTFSLQLFTYLDYLNRSELVEFPIEIDYGKSKDGFFLQVHCAQTGLFLENLMESVQDNDMGSPYSSLLKELSFKTNFLEVYTLKSTSRLVFTGVWKLQQETMPQSSLLIHQVERFNNKSGQEIDFDAETFFESDSDKIHKIRAIEKLPEKRVREEQNQEISNPVLVKRIVSFLNKKKNVVDGVLSGEIDKITIKGYIEEFPDKEAIAGLNDHDVEQVLRFLGDNIEEVEKQAHAIRDQIPEDDYVEGIVKSLEKMSSEEAQSALGYDEDNIQKILGQKEDLGEETQTVSGGEEAPEEQTRIKGVTENLQSEPWKVKRLEVAKKVESRLRDLRSQGASKTEINNEVQSILRKELNLKEDEGEKFSSALTDDATDDWVRGGLDPLNESIKQRIQLEKSQGQLQVRDNQIKKMKKLIDNMKNELIAKQKELNLTQGEGSASGERAAQLSDERESEKLNNEIIKLKEENELLHKKWRENQESLGEIRGSDEDVGSLQKENSNLKSQIDALKKRISFMYENSKSNSETSLDASDIEKMVAENDLLKSQKQGFNQELEGLKTEKRELDHKLRTLSAENDRLKVKADNKKMSQEDRQQMIEKDRDIERLKGELKRSQDEIKAYQLKGKSYEQKIKFMSAQLDKASGSKSSKSSGPTAAESKLASKLKHAETTSIRLKEAADKLNKELGEKKTELHKAKLEAKTMENKVKELEKKLAQNEKKRAA